MSYRRYRRFQALKCYSYVKEIACLLKDKEVVEFPEKPTSWKAISELMTGNVIISEVDALKCVVGSKAEKHVSNGELVLLKIWRYNKVSSVLKRRT